MKILGRIVIILIAALAVVGAATTLVGNSSGSFSEAGSEQRPLVQDQVGSISSGQEGIGPTGRFHEGERDTPSLFGIVSVIQNLVIVSLIIGLVALGPRFKGVLARLTGSFHNI